MSFQITGKLHKKFDTESKTDTFQTREFVIVINESNYPQYIKFQLTQDRCGLIEPYEPGTEIEVHFDLRGREWNEKYFTNLNAWKINVGQSANQQDMSGTPAGFDQTATEPPVTFNESSNIKAEDFDDLPF